MATTAQISQYCAQHVAACAHYCTVHFPPHTITKTVTVVAQPKGHIMDYFTIAWWVAVVAVAYTVGRVGLATFWSDLVSAWTWLKSKV